MIVDPPLLTIRANFPRPEARFVAAFAGAQTGNVVDAMGGSGALDFAIKPLEPASKVMVGVALTCNCGPGDNLALFGAMSIAEPGDILVAATGAFKGAAVTGDLMLGMALNQSVDFRKPVRSHAKQIIGKPAHFRAGPGVFCPKGPPHMVRILLSHIRLEKHLQSQFAGFSASTH